MKIVVTGATGFIGQQLLPVLQLSGHSLVVVTRNIGHAKKRLLDAPGSLQNFERVEFVTWDPESGFFPGECLQDADAVINLVGENIAVGRWTKSRKDLLVQSRVETTRQLVRALPASVKIFLNASAVGIYPTASSQSGVAVETYHESYFPSEEEAQKSFIVGLTRAWEQEARAAAQPGASGQKERCSVQMRIGIVLGHDGFLKKILPFYRLGLGGPIGTGKQILPWIHIADLVNAIAWVTENVRSSRAIHLVGPAPVSYAEISRGIARLLNRPDFLRVPAAALKIALGEQSEIALASALVYPEYLLENGFSFRFQDHESALADLIQKS